MEGHLGHVQGRGKRTLCIREHPLKDKRCWILVANNNKGYKNVHPNMQFTSMFQRPTKQMNWPLTPIIPLSPFAKEKIDFIGPIQLTSKKRNIYIILATDYETKWMETKVVKRNNVATSVAFIYMQMIMRFSPSLELVSD